MESQELDTGGDFTNPSPVAGATLEGNSEANRQENESAVQLDISQDSSHHSSSDVDSCSSQGDSSSLNGSPVAMDNCAENDSMLRDEGNTSSPVSEAECIEEGESKVGARARLLELFRSSESSSESSLANSSDDVSSDSDLSVCCWNFDDAGESTTGRIEKKASDLSSSGVPSVLPAPNGSCGFIGKNHCVDLEAEEMKDSPSNTADESEVIQCAVSKLVDSSVTSVEEMEVEDLSSTSLETKTTDLPSIQKEETLCPDIREENASTDSRGSISESDDSTIVAKSLTNKTTIPELNIVNQNCDEKTFGGTNESEKKSDSPSSSMSSSMQGSPHSVQDNLEPQDLSVESVKCMKRVSPPEEISKDEQDPLMSLDNLADKGANNNLRMQKESCSTVSPPLGKRLAETQFSVENLSNCYSSPNLSTKSEIQNDQCGTSASTSSTPDISALNSPTKRDEITKQSLDDSTEAQNLQCEAVDLSKGQDYKSENTIQPCFNLSDDNSTEFEKIVSESCESSSSKAFPPISREETGFPEAFDGHVTIGKYISVKGDFTLRSSEALVESPSLIAPFLLKEPDIFPENEQGLRIENKGFFQSSVGEFLIGLGLSRCNEWYYRDMVHFKSKQMKREGKLPELEEDLKIYQSNYLQAKMANETYTFPNKTCPCCGFTSESAVVLEGHLLVPHVTSRREYQCNFCPYLQRDPKTIVKHMKADHNKIGHIEPPLFLYECSNCIFECNTRAKLSSHLSRCMKYHDRATVQLPPKDFEFPSLTPKPITVAVVKAYEKSLNCIQSRYKKPRKVENILDTFQHHLSQLSGHSRVQLPYESNYGMGLDYMMQMSGSSRKAARSSRPQVANSFGPSLSQVQYSQANKYFQVVNSGNSAYPTASNDASSPLQFPLLACAPTHKGTASQGLKGLFPGVPQLPKLQGPYPVPLDKSMPCLNLPLQPNSLVVCEICDGYIKDMEQLRTHMQLIHKVKIHPKVLASRPPLNCQKCQWRFFTDQGLERHLLGAHGLVTSNMQELANKSKDSGCCTICGRVFASKLVVHMNQIHKVTLKPAHLSYKCTVCSATFNLYRLFENHVYLVHSSSSSKRPAENSDPLPGKKMARGANWEHVSSGNREKQSRRLAEKENGTS